MVFFCVFTIRNDQKSSFHIIFGWTSLDFWHIATGVASQYHMALCEGGLPCS